MPDYRHRRSRILEPKLFLAAAPNADSHVVEAGGASRFKGATWIVPRLRGSRCGKAQPIC
jgi:hypothetical protein